MLTIYIKGGSGGGGTGGTGPPLASLIIYSFLNNFVIFPTLVHLRKALSYYVDLPVKLSFRSLQVYTTVFYPVFSNATIMNCFPVPPPLSEILDPPVLYMNEYNLPTMCLSMKLPYVDFMYVT